MSTLWQQGCVLEVMGILWLSHFFVFLVSSVTAGRLEFGNTTSTDIRDTGVACACGAPKALDTGWGASNCLQSIQVYLLRICERRYSEFYEDVYIT